jgi:hypothetical protein
MKRPSSALACAVPEGPYVLEVDTKWDATSTWAQLIELTTSAPDRPIGSGATQGMAHVATRFQRLDNLTLHDGVPGSVSVMLADAPQTGALRANLRN